MEAEQCALKKLGDAHQARVIVDARVACARLHTMMKQLNTCTQGVPQPVCSVASCNVMELYTLRESLHVAHARIHELLLRIHTEVSTLMVFVSTLVAEAHTPCTDVYARAQSLASGTCASVGHALGLSILPMETEWASEDQPTFDIIRRRWWALFRHAQLLIVSLTLTVTWMSQLLLVVTPLCCGDNDARKTGDMLYM